MRVFLKALLAATAAMAVGLPTGAGAAVVSGSNLGQPPNSAICSLPGVPVMDCTTAITGLPLASRAPGGALAGATGVITSWSVRTGVNALDYSVRLRVIRSDTGIASGPVETLPKAAGIYTYGARVPVQINDMIGIDTLGVEEMKGVHILRSTSNAYLDYWASALVDGETRAPFSNEAANLELLINATIEPDGDGDGWGDETQDKCPGAVDPTNACAPPPSGGGGGGGGGGPVVPPPAVVPDTVITKGPKGTVTAKKATFRFTSTVAVSTFQCKLDRKPWRSCKSPRAYKGLAEGRHAFRVKAVGPTGLVDPSPAKRTFKVEP